MKTVYALAAVVALTCSSAHAQRPPLIRSGNQGYLTLPEGWRACGTQAGDIQVSAVPDGGTQAIFALPHASEVPLADEANRLLPYVVYVRAEHPQFQPLCLPTTVMVVPRPVMKVSAEETLTGLRITLESEEFARYPVLAMEARRWLPPEPALAEGTYSCEASRCTLEVAVADATARAVLRNRLASHETAAAWQQERILPAQAQRVEAWVQEAFHSYTIRSEVTVLPPRDSANRGVLLSAQPEKRRTVVLPADLLACTADNAAVKLNGTVLELRDSALQQKLVKLKVVQKSTHPTCAAAQGATEDLTLHLLPPTFRHSDLDPNAPSKHIALDWSPTQAKQLRVHVRSHLLARSPELHERLRVRIGGMKAQGHLLRPCDTARDECVYSVVAPVDWKHQLSVSLQLVTPSSDLLALQEEGGVIGDTLFWAEDGKPLETGLQFLQVGQWFASDAAQNLTLTIPPALLSEEVLALPLEEPLARLVTPGIHKCRVETIAGDLDNCLLIEPIEEASPAIKVRVIRQTQNVLDALRANQQLTASLKPPNGVTLIHPLTWGDVGAFALTARKLQCNYTVEQLTRTFGELQEGQVLFRAQRPADPRCPEPAAWFVTTSEASVKLRAEKLSLQQGVFALHFLSLPSVGTRGPTTVPLSFFWDARNMVPASSAVLKIEALARPRVVGVHNVLRTPFGPGGAAPPESLSSASTALPTTRLRLLAQERPNWVMLDAPHARNWRLELAGAQARPCHLVSMSERGQPILPFREGLVCLEGASSEGQVSRLEATLVGTPAEFASAGIVLPESLRTRSFSLGMHVVDLPEVRRLRLAVPLARMVQVVCTSSEQGRVVPVASDVGPRALIRSRDSRCDMVFRMPISSFDYKRLPAQQHTANRELKEELLTAALEQWGPLETQMSIETSTDGGKSWTAFSVTSPHAGALRIASVADLHGLRSQLSVIDQGRGLELAIPIEPFQGGRLRLDDYGEMRIGLKHAPSAESFLNPETGLKLTETSRYEGHLRWILPPGPPFVLAPRSTGVGTRSRLSLTFPVGLLRTTNSGYDIKKSSDYGKLELATIAVGALYVVEGWDFNRNEARWILNPQLHVGIFANSKLSNLLQTPRPSFILGVGFRLPGGTSPTSVAETSSGIIVWGEVTRGQRQSPQLSLLLGWSLQVGAVGT